MTDNRVHDGWFRLGEKRKYGKFRKCCKFHGIKLRPVWQVTDFSIIKQSWEFCAYRIYLSNSLNCSLCKVLHSFRSANDLIQLKGISNPMFEHSLHSHTRSPIECLAFSLDSLWLHHAFRLKLFVLFSAYFHLSSRVPLNLENYIFSITCVIRFLGFRLLLWEQFSTAKMVWMSVLNWIIHTYLEQFRILQRILIHQNRK